MTADYENVRRGDVFYADLKQGIGSEQSGLRPVLVVQNDMGNMNAPTTIVVAITSKMAKPKLPTHISLPAAISGIKRDSIILAEQIRTIDKHRLRDRIAHIDQQDGLMKAVAKALKISIGLA
ncbi:MULTISPECIES: type II toxin-antitoxin system PemK/MazF family toxin [Fructobacillus]|jgi:mRNA interferase MazF|uniref:mRNA interferase n=3 Tax=Fructobacillus TaxID=559173 RepID=A0A3F3HEW8_9LACO|nr:MULTISPECIES: type II toxin-antitoxin system PemK/MazF family toxin [Fructobacillus]CAK1232574.1 mRNA-degrading endonuclease MazF [Fructobacillus sp. LMG 32999]KMK53704.1 mRNA interferase EndoA [Fructobacillus sp. EFB-N1]MCK8628069.1 type II toxin-antitoxin system PemK/MazF family toxin [Fructobacillus cardui]NLS38333.1 type II toxin-antitoxin system PemK/MazF family toxin [Fructobacillus tropaeoli]CAK1222275.1 mRNA-degrading endonuclease MazF [Fructobacillus cardui]